MTIEPFRISVPDSALCDLNKRLARTRWPDAIPHSGWQYGLELEYMQAIRDYWLNGFNWRRHEADWNKLPHYRFQSDGMRVHFLHVRGRGVAPLPIIVTHGWPGSFLEMLRLVPRLADPSSFGGDPNDAFDVVVPSLPGYGFSDRPNQMGVNTFQIAGIWAKLMQELGYSKFLAQGGDFGANVSTVLAWKHPDRVIGIHLNYIPGSYRPYLDIAESPMTEEERQFQVDDAHWLEKKGGYCSVQIAQPQTLAFALADSPMGLAAWIIDKFRDWSDCDGHVEARFTKDELLANVTLYWLTETAGSSMRLYFVRVRELPCTSPKRRRSPLPRRWQDSPKRSHFHLAPGPSVFITSVGGQRCPKEVISRPGKNRNCWLKIFENSQGGFGWGPRLKKPVSPFAGGRRRALHA